MAISNQEHQRPYISPFSNHPLLVLISLLLKPTSKINLSPTIIPRPNMLLAILLQKIQEIVLDFHFLKTFLNQSKSFSFHPISHLNNILQVQYLHSKSMLTLLFLLVLYLFLNQQLDLLLFIIFHLKHHLLMLIQYQALFKHFHFFLSHYFIFIVILFIQDDFILVNRLSFITIKFINLVELQCNLFLILFLKLLHNIFNIPLLMEITFPLFLHSILHNHISFHI